MSDNIQEAESGTKVAYTKQSEKRAQISLKMIQLRMKQNKERASLAAQKKSLQKEETMNESFSASQIAALKAEYSKINGIDPESDIYKKLIAMLDRLDLKSLQSLAGAEVKFVSKLAQNRVMRKSMKKEEVQLDELSTNKLADYKKKAGENASAADKAGDTKTGNKRFSGIMKATRKQFDNDAKQKTEELSPKQKELDKNKNGKIDGTDLVHLRSKKKQPQGADFAAQRRKERLASNGRMDENIELDEAMSGGYYASFHKETGKIGYIGNKAGMVKHVKANPNHTRGYTGPNKKVGDIFGGYPKKTVNELTKEEFDIGEESINEKSDYEVYHKDYSGAVQAAIKQAEKRGYEVDMNDWHDKVATGPKKPSAGKTNSFSVKLKKDGKESKKALHLQVYNMDNHKYELNMYIEEIQLDELNKDTLYSYAKKSEKDQDDQYNKIGKGIRDKDPKSANKAGHKFSMRSIGQNRAEKRLAKEAAMTESIVDKIKAIKRGLEAKSKADDHFDKAGDPKNANASKDLKKAVRYHNLLNKEEVVLEAKKPKSFKDVKKKMKEEEKPNKATVQKGDDLTGKKEPIEINPELKS